MQCLGCYKENVEGYCATCRKKLFDGSRISHVLSFDTPKQENLPAYQERTKRLSISGVQLKYSLTKNENELELTAKQGTFILKPIPPATLLQHQDLAPENEHLTMQIASQVFNIPVAANALIYFKDGAPAYITRRFDVKEDGTKHLQEDFAQIIGKTSYTDGDNYKYSGTYEDIGKLIREKVAAYPPVLEDFFKVLVFNYIFSNGDAHLKNFSLVQTEFGDYRLSKAYDLLSTVMHTPNESDTALDLYAADTESKFYKKFGYYGRPDFETLADRMGLVPKRAQAIIENTVSKQTAVLEMIAHSFFPGEAKQRYAQLYTEKLRRFS